MTGLLKSLLGQPKTYIPLLVVLITWALGQVGFDITPELKESIYTLCAAAAAWLIRRGMVKEKELNATVEAKVEKRLDSVLNTIAAAQRDSEEDRNVLKSIQSRLAVIEVGGITPEELEEYNQLKVALQSAGGSVTSSPNKEGKKATPGKAR